MAELLCTVLQWVDGLVHVLVAALGSEGEEAWLVQLPLCVHLPIILPGQPAELVDIQGDAGLNGLGLLLWGQAVLEEVQVCQEPGAAVHG